LGASVVVAGLTREVVVLLVDGAVVPPSKDELAVVCGAEALLSGALSFGLLPQAASVMSRTITVSTEEKRFIKHSPDNTVYFHYT
jgi:hypothetical protein